MKIRITAAPLGQAPLSIRTEWIGCEFEVEVPSSGVQMGVRGGRAQNGDGYHVLFDHALEVLGAKSPQTAKWWKDRFSILHGQTLIFARNVYEELK